MQSCRIGRIHALIKQQNTVPLLFKDILCSHVAAQNKDPVPMFYPTLDFRLVPHR